MVMVNIPMSRLLRTLRRLGLGRLSHVSKQDLGPNSCEMSSMAKENEEEKCVSMQQLQQVKIRLNSVRQMMGKQASSKYNVAKSCILNGQLKCRLGKPCEQEFQCEEPILGENSMQKIPKPKDIDDLILVIYEPPLRETKDMMENISIRSGILFLRFASLSWNRNQIYWEKSQHDQGENAIYVEEDKHRMMKYILY